MRPLILRLQACFLALVFFAGNLGLPEADVLLDHGLGSVVDRPQVHIEGTGGCADHADHCPLGRLLANGSDLHLGLITAAPVTPPRFVVLVHRTLRAPASTPTLPYQSRAPPETA
jgi:hypothetical protein